MAEPTGPLPPNVNNGPGILAVSWIEAALGIGMLVARFYTRSRIIRKIGWDDWTMLFATILCLITTIIVTLEVHYGTGRHTAYLEPHDVTSAVKMIWLTAPFSTMGACFGKISIALFLLRITDHRRRSKLFLWSLIISLFIVNLILTIITFAQCTPVTFLWDRTNPNIAYHGTCWNPRVQQYYGYFQGSFSSASDFALALYPITFIWGLKVQLKIKIGLAILMGLGVIATIASVFKTVELKNLTTMDFTYDATNLVYWYITENWLIVIAACIPTLKPLYQIILKSTMPRFKSYFSSYSSTQRSTEKKTTTDEFSTSSKKTGNFTVVSSRPEGITVTKEVDIV